MKWEALPAFLRTSREGRWPVGQVPAPRRTRGPGSADPPAPRTCPSSRLPLGARSSLRQTLMKPRGSTYTCLPVQGRGISRKGGPDLAHGGGDVAFLAQPGVMGEPQAEIKSPSVPPFRTCSRPLGPETLVAGGAEHWPGTRGTAVGSDQVGAAQRKPQVCRESQRQEAERALRSEASTLV